MGQVTALGQVHAHHRVTGVDQCQEDRRVGLGARMGLHVSVVAIEQGLDPLDGQPLGHIDVFAAAVIALAGVAFGVLVGEHRALGFHHQRAGIVFRGDQLDMVFLAMLFVVNRFIQLRVESIEGQRRVVHVQSVLGQEFKRRVTAGA